MANDIDKKDAYKSELTGSAESSGGETEKRESKRTDAPAGAQTEPAAAVMLERRTDHTPPPILITSGCLTIETDEEFIHRDGNGKPGHTRRHKLRDDREILGVRVLGVSGKTIYEKDDAKGTSVKIWFNKNVETEQVFIGDGTFHIESTVDLGDGVSITHPPDKVSVQRVMEYTHPAAGHGPHSRGIEKLEIIKGGQTVFPDPNEPDHRGPVWMVMLWDTAHE